MTMVRSMTMVSNDNGEQWQWQAMTMVSNDNGEINDNGEQ